MTLIDTLRLLAVSALRWFLLDMFVPMEDFGQTVRKIFALCGVLLVPSALLAATVCAYTAVHSVDSAVGLWIVVVDILLIAIENSAFFLLLRITKVATDLATGVFVTTVTAQAAFAFLAVPQYDTRLALAFLSLLVIVSKCRWPFLAAQLAALITAVVCSVYNDAYRGSSNVLLTVPDYVLTQSRPVWAVLEGAALLSFVIVALAVYVQVTSYSGALAQAEGNVCMSDEVVGLLRDYDTDGVTEVLSSYEASGTSDARLLSGLRALNLRLQLYRPHLPNYVLRSEEDESGNHRSLAASMAASRALRKGSSPADREEEGATNSRRVSLAPTTHWLGLDPIGKVTLAHASFLRVQSTQVTQIVDSIYRLAAVFRGSVHHVVGDVAVVSWNATDRVLQHEAKAAKFLFRLCRTLQALASKAAGVAFAGDAECLAVRSGTQETMLIHARWLPAMHHALKLAERGRTVLINAEANSIAEYEVVTQAVDCVRYSPSDSQTYCAGSDTACLYLDSPTAGGSGSALTCSSVLFEVLQEVDRSDTEWMYQLAKSEQQDNIRVTAALRRALSGCFDEALEQLPAAVAERSDGGLLTRLRDVCEQQLLRPAAYISADFHAPDSVE